MFPLSSPENSESQSVDKQIWTPFLTALRSGGEGQPIDPALEAFSRVLGSYAQGKPAEFNQAVAEYGKLMEDRAGRLLLHVRARQADRAVGHHGEELRVQAVGVGAVDEQPGQLQQERR